MTYTLHHGDCLEVMAGMEAGSVDCIVTSPPYNQLEQTGGGIHGRGGWLANVQDNGYPDAMDEASYQQWMQAVLDECLRVCRGTVWVNHKTRYRNRRAIHPLDFLHGPLWCEIVWARPGGIALGARRFVPSHELILGFGDPAVWNDEYKTAMSVWHIAPEADGRGHPCAFPVALPKLCILATTSRGMTVLDPFTGSGTTGVACAMEGRDFIGIEREAEYVEIARRRIDAAAAQLRMDVEA